MRSASGLSPVRRSKWAARLKFQGFSGDGTKGSYRSEADAFNPAAGVESPRPAEAGGPTPDEVAFVMEGRMNEPCMAKKILPARKRAVSAGLTYSQIQFTNTNPATISSPGGWTESTKNGREETVSKRGAILKIEGMSCDHCVRTVRQALQDTEGIDVVDVEIGSARIVFHEPGADPDAAAHAVDETGFEVVEIRVD